MPVATPTDRRAALRLGLAVTAATIASPAISGLPGTDAELIRLCERLIDLDNEQAALLKAGTGLEYERSIDPRLDEIGAEADAILVQIARLPSVSTLPGMQAMARASIALAPRGRDGGSETPEDTDWLAFEVLQALAGGAA